MVWKVLQWGFLVIACATPSLSATADTCSPDDGQTCLANLQTLQLKDGGDVTKLSVSDLLTRCSDLRKNIACLLTNTQKCQPVEKRDQQAKVILEARKYVGAICEADESVKAHWKDNQCYRQASLQRCDREFQDLMHQKPASNPPTESECRNYLQYQSCVERTVASCSGDSAEFVALYLIDYASRLAWLCSEDYRRHQANTLPSDHSQQGKPAFSGSSGSSTCVRLIQNDMKRCFNRYQRQEAELTKKQQTRNKSTTVASDAQQVDLKPKVCCAFGAYTHCLQTAVQTRCSQDREALVDTIIAQTSKLIGGHCEEYFHGSPKCSSGAFLWTSSSSILLALVTLSTLPILLASGGHLFF